MSKGLVKHLVFNKWYLVTFPGNHSPVRKPAALQSKTQNSLERLKCMSPHFNLKLDMYKTCTKHRMAENLIPLLSDRNSFCL